MSLQAVWDAIQTHFTLHRVPPTFRQLATVCGCGVTQVYRRVHELERRGYLDVQTWAKRGIRLVDRPRQPLDADGGAP